MDDEIIKDNVIDELHWEPEILNPAAIGVAVEDGVVTLLGYVDSYVEKLASERAAKKVAGVQAVVQNIQVKLPVERNDVDIARSIRDALELDATVPSEDIKVKVEHGWVTLEGDADWSYQRTEAERITNRIGGVKGVTNLILLKQRPAPTDVKSQIEKALQRMAAIDADRITVESGDGTIILRGTVRSWAEKEEAERAARAAPGVVQVENRIGVVP